METKIGNVKDSEGNVIAPLTYGNCVNMADGKTLEQKFIDQSAEISRINNTLSQKANKSEIYHDSYITPSATGCNILTGGYIEIGNVVVLNLRIKATSTNPVVHLPTPIAEFVGVKALGADSSKDINNAVTRAYSALDIYPAIVGETYNINTVYLKQ